MSETKFTTKTFNDFLTGRFKRKLLIA